MYYRYKSKKRNNIVFKYLFLVLVACGVIFLGYQYKQYIFFWKFTYNKLVARIESVEKIADRTARNKQLVELNKICGDYKDDHPLSAEAFFMAGRVHLLLGESCLGGSFSELVIDDNLKNIDPRAEGEFLEAVKDVEKGRVLSGNRELDMKNGMVLARACFYTGYYGIGEVFKLIGGMKKPERALSVRDIRFSSIVSIMNNKEDQGLDLLKKHGGVTDSMEGLLFLATAERMGRVYTSSIMNFKKILGMTTDNGILKLAHANLGKIYFNQSLYKESLAHFTEALKIDDRDQILKIWIGKDYSALGDKTKARAIWTEVLTADRSNEEVKKLLGLM